MAEPTEVRKKIERARFPLHWLIIPAVILAAGGGIAWRMLRPSADALNAVVPGYLPGLPLVHHEYEKFYQKELDNPEVEKLVQQATASVSRHDLAAAAGSLEEAVKLARIPCIYNNLGVLYAELGDRSRTLTAFRSALALDVEYAPARKNLARLKDFASEADTLGRAVTREIEPNNTLALANLIGLGTPVDAEIASQDDDIDCFKLVAPTGPRDILKVEIANHSTSLAPTLALYDANEGLLNSGKDTGDPGATLVRNFSIAPRAAAYLKIWGGFNSSGPYVLTVQPAKAFDALEPNDDILTAHHIDVGEKVQANIMDPDDTDFFSFIAPRTGQVSVDIEPASKTLIPALTTFTPDMRNSGFGPDVRKPGGSLHHTFAVEELKVYFVQVWSQAHSSGKYSLTVK